MGVLAPPVIAQLQPADLARLTGLHRRLQGKHVGRGTDTRLAEVEIVNAVEDRVLIVNDRATINCRIEVHEPDGSLTALEAGGAAGWPRVTDP